MSSEKFELPKPLFFFDAVQSSTNNIYFVVFEQDDNGKTLQSSNIMRNKDVKWKYIGEINWRAVTVAPNNAGMLIGSENGDIATIDKEIITVFHLSDIYDGDFTLRKICSFKYFSLAVGYGGVFFSLDRDLNWIYNKICRSNKPSWIESVDIDKEGVQYFVGLKGEIWSDASGELVQLSVPTNSDLNDVCCSSNGYVYICGSDGLLLKGHGEKWTIIEPPEGFSDDFWRVIEFKDKIWVSSMKHLFEWTSECLLLNDMGDIYEISNYYNLRCNEQELMIVDERHTLSFDGNATRLIV